MGDLLTPGTAVVLARPLRWCGRTHQPGTEWVVFRAALYPPELGGPLYVLNHPGGTPTAYGPIANDEDLETAP